MSHQENLALADDALPTVSFDVRLGDQFDYVDFDYQVYADYLTERGSSADEIVATSIEIKKSGVDTLLKGRRGYYLPTDNHIEVSVPFFAVQKVNDRLAHESQHKVDNDQGKMTPGVVAINFVGNISSLASNGFLLSYFAAKAINSLANLPELNALGDRLYQYNLGALAVFGLSYYGLNPLERNARKAARANDAAFVTLTAKNEAALKIDKTATPPLFDWQIEEPALAAPFDWTKDAPELV